MFVVPDASRISPSMRRDMDDIYKMRFTGVSFTAFEARWSLLHVEELILDAEDGKPTGVLMNRVTDHYWKKFAYYVYAYFEMFGWVMWKTRPEKFYAEDDPIRKRKYGTGYSKMVEVKVPFVVPYFAVDLETHMDDNFRETITPLDKNGFPRKDIRVSYSRRGGLRVKTQTFETECGALLNDWRRFNTLTALHDKVARVSAEPLPFVEHMPINEQSRMQKTEGAIEDLHHGPVTLDKFGYEIPTEKVLRKIERPTETTIQPFVEVPADRKLSHAQVSSKLSFDLDVIHKQWIGHLASTLQIPLRHMQTEDNKGLSTGGNEATVHDDMARAVRIAGERRNEIVDVLAEAFESIFEVRPTNTHLPTASHMTPAMLFDMHDRGVMADPEVKDELSLVFGLKRTRFT